MFLMISTVGLVVSNCTKPETDPNQGIPRQLFDEVPLYSGPVNSIGTLTQAYIQNTEGLMTANSRLTALCNIYGRCEDSQEQ